MALLTLLHFDEVVFVYYKVMNICCSVGIILSLQFYYDIVNKFVKQMDIYSWIRFPV